MTSINHRKQNRIYYARMGSRTALVGGTLFFAFFIISFFLSSDSPIWNWFAASTHVAYFGIIFAVLFGRVGWSRNWFVDFFFNRISVWLFAIGATANVANDFLHHRIIGIVSGYLLGAGFVMALLGILFKTKAEAINSLDS